MTDEQSPTPDDPTKISAEERPGLFRSFFNQAGQTARDALSVTLGRLLEDPADESRTATAGPSEERPVPRSDSLRVNTLRSVAEHLRGAADSYVAAKLDELEARVDEKLDHIEERIDRKIVELHEQLAEMRDRELRHRLRLLKITLIFTVIVAVVSLVYRWISVHWI